MAKPPPLPLLGGTSFRVPLRARSVAPTLVLYAATACGGGAFDARGRDARVDSASDSSSRATSPRGGAAARSVGRASALHVVRAPSVPRAALEPLPESLVVELFDPRGRSAAGATVLWRVVAGGGGVVPSRSTTDSAGRARAAWTPGASGDVQTIAVEAPGAGAVELHVTVPPASVSAAPRRIALWPGDTASLSFALADAAGHALSGGAVRWESDDADVARVGANDGRVVAVGAGTTHVFAYAAGGVKSDAVDVTVLPVVAGLVVRLDGAPAAGAAVVVRYAGRADTISTDFAGRFARRLPATPDDTVDVLVGAPSGYRGAHLRVREPRELAALQVMLLPESWTIASGSHRGERVPVSPAAATARAVDGTRFWRLQRALPLETWTGVGWPADRLPVAVTFRRDEGDGAISPADSEAFWLAARTLERELGVSLFTPATPRPGDDEADRPLIQVLVDHSIATAGYTFASWNGDGEIGSAEVRVRSTGLLHDADVVIHELMHALGFGHTSSWASLMSNTPGRATELTAWDVAYAQLLFKARATTRSAGAPYGIVESAVAEHMGGRAGAPPRRDSPALP